MNPNGTVKNLRPFKPGSSGNPGGKPADARNRLSGAFVNALASDFERHGKAAIERCRRDSPARYLQIIASIFPKGVAVEARGATLEELLCRADAIEHLSEGGIEHPP